MKDSSSEANIQAAPLTFAERIHALDTTRGFAVLGILIMNIWSFAGPQSIYDYPLAATDWGGAPLQTWAVMHTLFEGSQRALFSMLFGAGMLLMVSRLDEHSPGVSSARIYYRRLMFLMLFGLFDLFVLLWPADILFVYALCGLVLYPLRNLRPTLLVLLAVVVFAGQGVLRTASWQETTQLQQEFVLQAPANDSPEVDDPAKAERREDWQAIATRAHPDLNSDEVQELIRVTSRGAFGEFFSEKLVTSLVLLIFVGLKSLLLDSLGAMLIGMALLRSKVLTLEAPPRTYLLMMLCGYGIGVPIAAWETYALINADFDAVLKARNLIHYDFRRVAVGLGHLGTILLFCRSFPASWLAAKLAAVGRMALSNYLLQSVLGLLIFTTLGLGLYGQFTGFYLYMVVAAYWVVLIAFSNWWLRRFRFGPAEWLWKSLTYKSRQPFRKANGK
jgi:uncharacterized protein